MFIKTKEQKDREYKRIHAMYSKGYTFDEMYSECGDMERWEVIHMVQIIEGKIRQRKEREARD